MDMRVKERLGRLWRRLGCACGFEFNNSPCKLHWYYVNLHACYVLCWCFSGCLCAYVTCVCVCFELSRRSSYRGDAVFSLSIAEHDNRWLTIVDYYCKERMQLKNLHSIFNTKIIHSQTGRCRYVCTYPNAFERFEIFLWLLIESLC